MRHPAACIAWLGPTLFRLGAPKTARLASTEDPDRLTVDHLMLLASITGLAAAVGPSELAFPSQKLSAFSAG